MTNPRLLRFAARDHGTLADNAAHGFAARHALVNYRSGAVMSFIPKNGAATLRLSLAYANGCVGDDRDWTWIHANTGTFAASLRDLATAPYTFVILRCPHTRLASGFLDKVLRREEAFWRLYRLSGDTIPLEDFTFRQFVEALADIPGALHVDDTWRPQVDFLVYERYDDTFALERLDDHLPTIEARAGLPLHDARPMIGTDTARMELVDGAFADTPLSELEEMRRTGRLPAHAALYDAGLAQEVSTLYSEDMALYVDRFGEGDLLFPETA